MLGCYSGAFARTRLHAFVIMPNHLHGIVEICAELGRSGAAPLRGTAAVQARSLGAIARSFKAAATKRVHERPTWAGPVWQRNYFERVVRNGEELSNATRYIKEDPAWWEWDRENPKRKPVPSQRTTG
jgi:putative transposase